MDSVEEDTLDHERNGRTLQAPNQESEERQLNSPEGINEPMALKMKEDNILECDSESSVKIVTQSELDDPVIKTVAFDSREELNDDSENDGNTTDIDNEIDDALDEGYMGMECTLERGFSLNETAIARDLRHERYDEVAVKYKRDATFTRYRPSLQHFIPFRKPPKEKDEMPVDKAGLFSYTTLSWISNLMWKAYKTGLKDEDIPICSKYDMCSYNVERLENLWNEEIKRNGKDNVSLQRVVWKFLRTRLLFALSIFMVNLILGFIGPTIFMRLLISWLSTEEPMTMGAIWTTGLLITEFTRTILFCLVWCINYQNGVRLRAACLGLVYKKLMRMSNLGSKSVGEVINLFANDAQRIYDLVVLGPLIIGGPVVGAGGVAYILWLLGPWALFGMVAFLLFYPFQYGISRLTGYLRRKTIAVTDERVRMVNELLTCVKLIKMYAWEKSFASTIAEIRCRERRLLEKSAYVQSISLAMAPTVPIIAAIVTFLAHIGAGYNLTAAQAWSYYGLAGLVHFGMDCITYSLQHIREGQISLKRCKNILLMDELTPYVEEPQTEDIAVALHDATLAWNIISLEKKGKEKRRNKNDTGSPADDLLQKVTDPQCIEVLFGISLSVKRGELIAVCGGVGAGKSSLISALLGHMQLNSGKVYLHGACAYVGQQAWILNASFRDNILLDETFDAKKYYRVIHACNLNQDIASMPAGDFTEIGERGINLSGGQKQRLSLARAIYADKQVYLLDDPLSAVDAHVGNHIFQWVIKGALREKTTIFVTHQLQYLPQCDRIVYLRDGCVFELGTHNDLMKANNEYAALYTTHMQTVKDINEREIEPSRSFRIRQDSVMSSDSGKSGSNGFIPERGLVVDALQNAAAGTGQLITEEQIEKGDIPKSTYHSYIMAAGGYIIATLVILTFILNVGSTAFSSWWLSLWLSAGSGVSTI